MNILLDTNILLRFVDPGHAQGVEARQAVTHLRSQGHTLCLVPQNFYEFWVVSTRPLAQNGRGQSPDDVLQEFTFLDTQFQTFDDTADVFTHWLGLMRTHKVVGKPAHDARLVAAMLARGVTHLLTFNDTDFRRYAGVTAVTPAAVLAPPPATP